MTTEYDPRYMLGIAHFNAQEYFDAHEIWEDLWRECAAHERRFYQSLIQAAVALYHAGRGNHLGADRLLRSGRAYMLPYAPHYQGLNVEDFWAAVERGIQQAIPPCLELTVPPNSTA